MSVPPLTSASGSEDTSDFDDEIDIYRNSDNIVFIDPFSEEPYSNESNVCQSVKCQTTTAMCQTRILNRLFCGSSAAPSCALGPRMLERCNDSSFGASSTLGCEKEAGAQTADPSKIYTEKLFSFLSSVKSPINSWYNNHDKTKKPAAAIPVPIPEDVMVQEMSELKQLAYLAQNTAANQIRTGLHASCESFSPLVTRKTIKEAELVRKQQRHKSSQQIRNPPRRKVRFEDPPVTSIKRRPYFSEVEKNALFYNSNELMALQRDQEESLYWDTIEVVAF